MSGKVVSGASTKKEIVYVAVGAGTKPVEVDYKQGDTVASVLKRAELSYSDNQSPTLGKKRVRNPEKTPVNPGDTIVVAGRPANG